MRYLFCLFISLPCLGQPVKLTVKGLSFGVDVGTGARVVSLMVGDQEVLGSSAIHTRFYGSSLWLSPEGKWKGMGALDTGPYTVVSRGDRELVLRCMPDSVRGFSFTKEFSLEAGDTSVAIHYTITNTLAGSQEVAPWEVTRVPTGGLAFFPAGATAALSKSDLMVRDTLGYCWYSYDTSAHVRQKLFRHGAEGWTAYVRNGILFVKSYPVFAVGRAAPGEENVEIYVNPERTYIELENQGAYQQLQAGESLSYDVRWYARRLPAGIGVGVGDRGLINFIQQFINSHNR